jgi:hypothetical protein
MYTKNMENNFYLNKSAGLCARGDLKEFGKLTLKGGCPPRQEGVETRYFGSVTPKLPVNVHLSQPFRGLKFWSGGPISVEESPNVLS